MRYDRSHAPVTGRYTRHLMYRRGSGKLLEPADVRAVAPPSLLNGAARVDNLIAWLNTRPARSRATVLVALVTVPVILVAVVGLFLAPAAPFAGALAGVALFVAAYGYWHTMVPAGQQASTDLKARYGLKKRRGLVGGAVAVWLILLLLLGRYAPGPLLGTLNVFVLISLYWLWRATPAEAAEALARWEAAQEAKTEAEKQAALRADYEEADPYYYGDED